MTVEQLAKIVHGANKAYCEAHGDFSQKPWDEAEGWQRESAIAGVRGISRPHGYATGAENVAA